MARKSAAALATPTPIFTAKRPPPPMAYPLVLLRCGFQFAPGLMLITSLVLT